MATVPTIPNFTVAEIVPQTALQALASALELMLGQGSNVAPCLSAALASGSTAQVVSSGGSTKRVALTAVEDSDAAWSGVNYLVVTPGLWDMAGAWSYQASATSGLVYGGLYVNNQAITSQTTSFATDAYGRISTAAIGVRLNVGDTVDIRTYQASGSPVPLNTTAPSADVAAPFLRLAWRRS